MNIGKIHADGIAAVQAEEGANCPQFTWPANGGANYLALPGGAKRKRDLGLGGYIQDADLKIVCLTAQFNLTSIQLRAQMPESQLAYDGKVYRITQIDIFPQGQTMRIECEDAAQRTK